MKKTTRRRLRQNLDKLVKDYVKRRDNYTCQKCGKKLASRDCHGSHVIPVSAGLRWAYDPENIKILCFHCHINWWHKNPTESGVWFKQKFPERWVYIERVKPEYNKHESIKDFQLEELYQELKSKGLD